jgi:hypothetical protein
MDLKLLLTIKSFPPSPAPHNFPAHPRVPDPEPDLENPYVYEPPGFFHQQEKNLEKFLLFCDFFMTFYL